MSIIDTSPESANPLLSLIDLGHRARAAAGLDELAFLLVNDTRLLVPYRQSVLWFEQGGVRTLSGVLQPEENAPYAQWLSRVCRELSRSEILSSRRVGPADLSPEVAAEWSEWFPAEALWIPIAVSAEHPGSCLGGLLLAGEIHFGDDSLILLGEWLDSWRHAWLARVKPSGWSFSLMGEKGAGRSSQGKWWQRRSSRIGLGILLLLMFPVRLTVLAPGELVPANPAVIRAPMEGVIGQFHVQPNETVKAGQILFSFDEAPMGSRLQVARQTLETAEVEYRQLAQMAVSDAKSKGQLAGLIGKVGEKRAEAEFLGSQFERSKVLAPQDGVVIFDDPSEWIGRPVQTGERVMRIAHPNEVEIEAWLSIGDAIPLDDGAAVSLYLAASPFSAVSGQLRYISHEAVPRPDGSYAYRARARLGDTAAGPRIGLKGTAKFHGDWAPLGYWVLRRPLASIRQFLAI